MMPRTASLVVVALALAACAKKKDAGTAAKQLNRTIDAVEALSLAFRDSAFAAHDTTRIVSQSARDPSVSSGVPDACEAPESQLPIQTHTTPDFAIALPADFEPTRGSAAGVYDWHGEDNSTIRLAWRRDTVVDGKVLGLHRGWTGQMSSECDVDVAGRAAHVDIANATTGAEDRVVHMHYADQDLGSSGARTFRRSLVLIAHARSIERQRELLRAARSVRFLSP
jgi:hypothetical protein